MIRVLFLSALLQTPQSTPEVVFDFETKVPVISFYVKAMAGNRPVLNLKKKDFSLRENQLQVKISHVEPVFLGRTLEILVDSSSSNTDQLVIASKIIEEIIHHMTRKDQVKISSFSNIYLEWTPFSSDKRLLLNSLKNLIERNSTALYDTLNRALESLSHQNGPKALILISDGYDLISSTSKYELTSRIENLGIPLFIIYSGAKPSKEAYLLVDQYQYLKSLVPLSKGRWFQSKDGFSRELERAIEDLSHRYKISYQPPQAENIKLWRRRQLTVRNKEDTQLLYTKGYLLSP